VAVDRIAKELEAQLRFSPLDSELSGMVYVKDGTPIIGINALHHPNRQRFTLAHEVGHLVLHRPEITKQIHVDKAFPMLMRNAISAAGVDEMEIEANCFAAELLMPEEFVARSLEGQPFDIDDEGVVSALAKQYRVSTAAMRFRLGNLFA
jgi:Zn-dependent peptidase ImmA (M78 family)